ncbi:MAG: methionyl-tRNA formyltransferase, partial [Sphingobacteriaceae bacterium]|nr:methionyl-tRNA formyltransferase [Sphingobacteriaceae bacterium]
HGSLLPQYRGAAPINHAIINGETESGVTTFFLKHEIDTGDIIFSEKVAIQATENAGQLHDKLMDVGATLIVKTLKAIEANTVKEIPQDPNVQIKHAPKIFKDFCKIDWNQTTQSIYNLIRGLSPYPTAFTYLNDKILKVFDVEMEIVTHQNEIGSFQTDGKTYLKYCTIDGFINLKEVQYEGKKKMKIDEFLRGMRL